MNKVRYQISACLSIIYAHIWMRWIDLSIVMAIKQQRDIKANNDAIIMDNTKIYVFLLFNSSLYIVLSIYAVAIVCTSLGLNKERRTIIYNFHIR